MKIGRPKMIDTAWPAGAKMKTTFYNVIVALGCAFSVTAPASAQTDGTDWQTCINPNSAPEQAIASCTQTLSQARRMSAVQVATAYNYRGYAYRRKGDNNRALTDIDEAISINPGYALAYSNRGYLHASMGNRDKAIRDYDEAVRLEPSNPLFYYVRGQTHASGGNLDQAINDFNRAIELRPGEAAGYKERGRAYALKGEHARAVSDFDRALSINPQLADAQKLRDESRARLSGSQSASNTAPAPTPAPSPAPAPSVSASTNPAPRRPSVFLCATKEQCDKSVGEVAMEASNAMGVLVRSLGIPGQKDRQMELYSQCREAMRRKSSQPPKVYDLTLADYSEVWMRWKEAALICNPLADYTCSEYGSQADMKEVCSRHRTGI